MIEIRNGSAFNAKGGILCQLVHCQGMDDGGSLQAFATAYPTAYHAYIGYCEDCSKQFGETAVMLGDTIIFKEEAGRSCCMFAQNQRGGNGLQYINYNAFRMCCAKLRFFLRKYRLEDIDINMSSDIGCVEAGGDIDAIKEILNDELAECNVILWRECKDDK